MICRRRRVRKAKRPVECRKELLFWWINEIYKSGRLYNPVVPGLRKDKITVELREIDEARNKLTQKLRTLFVDCLTFGEAKLGTCEELICKLAKTHIMQTCAQLNRLEKRQDELENKILIAMKNRRVLDQVDEIVEKIEATLWKRLDESEE